MDERARALGRVAKASGSVEDREAWLRARVRCGDLNIDSLSLAAWCRDPAAASFQGEGLREVDEFRTYFLNREGEYSFSGPGLCGLGQWVDWLADEWGTECRLRSYLAFAASVLNGHEVAHPELRETHALTQEALSATTAWVSDPSRTESAATASQLGRELKGRQVPWDWAQHPLLGIVKRIDRARIARGGEPDDLDLLVPALHSQPFVSDLGNPWVGIATGAAQLRAAARAHKLGLEARGLHAEWDLRHAARRHLRQQAEQALIAWALEPA
jgi:hypothetical protein